MRPTHQPTLLRNDRLEETLARMSFLVERGRPLGFLSGMPGIGKTTALQLLEDELRSPGRQVIRLSAAGMSAATLLAAMTAELGIGRSDRFAADAQGLLVDYLAGVSFTRGSAALLLDDFDMADDSCIGVLSSLMRRLAATSARLSIVAAVRETESAAWHDLAKSSADFVLRLSPWLPRETAKYVLGVIERRNRASRGEVCSIDDAGLRALHESSAGIPGRIVRILELSLIACEALEELSLSEDIIWEAAHELFPRPAASTRMPLRPVEV
jgi:type II secretory pathway predicted ATPase ExeA